MKTTAEIAEILRNNGYSLLILSEGRYEIRDHLGKCAWDFEHSRTPLNELDIELFLDICGRSIH